MFVADTFILGLPLRIDFNQSFALIEYDQWQPNRIHTEFIWFSMQLPYNWNSDVIDLIPGNSNKWFGSIIFRDESGYKII